MLGSTEIRFLSNASRLVVGLLRSLARSREHRAMMVAKSRVRRPVGDPFHHFLKDMLRRTFLYLS